MLPQSLAWVALSAEGQSQPSAPFVKVAPRPKPPIQKGLDGTDYLYGIYPVLMALRAGKRKCRRIWVQSRDGPSTLRQKDLEARREIEERIEKMGLRKTEGPKAQLDHYSENRPHQGYVLKCEQLLPMKMKESEMPLPSDHALWIALEGVTDPQNFGAVLRSAGFFGADGVLCERGSARLTAVASKASAGVGEMIPIHGVNNLTTFLGNARTKGWRVAALETPDDEEVEDRLEEKPQVSLPEKKRASSQEAPARSLMSFVQSCRQDKTGLILVLGGEGWGVRARLKSVCDVLLQIEGGYEGLDSLNVSVAAGVALHAIRSEMPSIK